MAPPHTHAPAPVVQVVWQLVQLAQAPLGQRAPPPAADASWVVVEALRVAHEEEDEQEEEQEGREHEVGQGGNTEAWGGGGGAGRAPRTEFTLPQIHTPAVRDPLVTHA